MNDRLILVGLICGVMMGNFNLTHAQELQRYNPNRELIEGIVLPNTELFKIHSEILGSDFLIYVQLPNGYKNNPEKKYPVWYNTDANRLFPLMANASVIMSEPGGIIPEVIVVGIGYLVKGMDELTALRTRDLTPVQDPETDRYWTDQLMASGSRKDLIVRSGGAPQFLDFIIKELIPDVESKYRTMSDQRTLGGYDFGGLFTLYALFHHPESFRNYFAGSPRLSYSSEVLFRYESEFAEMHQDLNARIFITAGDREGEDMVSHVNQLVDQLTARRYPNLKIDCYILKDEDHVTGIGAAYMQAYKRLLGYQ